MAENSRKKTPSVSRRWLGYAFVSVAVFAVFGLLDALLTLGGSGATAPSLMGVGLSVSLWSVAGLIWAAVLAFVVVTSFGRDGDQRVRSYAASTLRRWWQERGGEDDRARMATFIGAAVGLGVWLSASFLMWRYLIEHRHGPALIAITGIAAQVILVAPAAWIGRVLQRVAGPLTDRLPSFINLMTTLAAIAVLLAGGLVAVFVVFSDVVDAVEGVAILLVMLAAIASVPLAGRFGARAEQKWALVAPVVGVVGVFAFAQSTGARAFVRMANAAPFLYTASSAWSDFDGDGSTTFPVMRDCAPFDSDRHPLAMEIPENGIDENCDGKDTAPEDATNNDPKWQRKGTKPNIIFVTFDATRADHVGFMGHDRETTPNLDRLAERGVVFEKAFSQDSGTGPSFWSLMTGKTPFQVDLYNAHRFPPYIRKSEFMLGEMMKEAGYTNYAVLCGTLFDREYWTIKDGFTHWENVCGKEEDKVAPLVTREAKKVLREAKTDEPFLLWVHYFEPHHTYTRHEEFDFGDDKLDRYDSEIRYADHHFGEFWKAVQKADLKHPTYFVFTADHGEAFGEHGPSPHARTLYREVTHVPLMVSGPDIEPRRIDAPVAVGDIYPTFAQLAGQKVPEESTMVSLVPILSGMEPDADRLVFMENSYSRPRHHQKGVVSGRYHFIMDLTTGVEEMYDYEVDPREQRNLIGQGLPEEEYLRRRLKEFISTTNIPKGLR